VSAYEVAKFCRSCLRDTNLRALARADPHAALDQFHLNGAERTALLAGDVGALYSMGAPAFLLSYLPRWQIFELDVATYSQRMRAAAHPPALPGTTGRGAREQTASHDRPSDDGSDSDHEDSDHDDEPAAHTIGRP